MPIDNAYRIQILQQTYEAGSKALPLKNYIQNEAENDPGFFYFFFDHAENLSGDFGGGMTESQQQEWEQFLMTVEQD